MRRRPITARYKPPPPFVVEDGKPGAEGARLLGPAHRGSSPAALSRPDLVAGADEAVLKVRPLPPDARRARGRLIGLSGTRGFWCAVLASRAPSGPGKPKGGPLDGRFSSNHLQRGRGRPSLRGVSGREHHALPQDRPIRRPWGARTLDVGGVEGPPRLRDLRDLRVPKARPYSCPRSRGCIGIALFSRRPGFWIIPRSMQRRRQRTNQRYSFGTSAKV